MSVPADGFFFRYFVHFLNLDKRELVRWNVEVEAESLLIFWLD